MKHEAQVLERQSGRNFVVLANKSIQCSEYIYARGSDMYAEAAVDQLRQLDNFIERSSDEVTCGEIARSREPCARREFMECNNGCWCFCEAKMSRSGGRKPSRPYYSESEMAAGVP